MKYEKSCGAVVYTKINNEVKFVLVRQLKGFYGFPKGHVEDGETEKETALREIKEETGLDVTLIDGFISLDEHPIPERPGTIKQVTYFLAKYENQKIEYPKEELMSVDLYSYEDAIDLFQFENQKEMLKNAKDFLINNNLY